MVAAARRGAPSARFHVPLRAAQALRAAGRPHPVRPGRLQASVRALERPQLAAVAAAAGEGLRKGVGAQQGQSAAACGLAHNGCNAHSTTGASPTSAVAALPTRSWSSAGPMPPPRRSPSRTLAVWHPSPPLTPRRRSSGDLDGLWRRLLRYINAGFLMGAHTPASPEERYTTMGICLGHACAWRRCRRRRCAKPGRRARC
jgi:hypothetical protein